MEKKTKQQDMTNGVIWKELVLFFLPIAAGTLFQQFYNAVDAIIVGKFVGTEALAAVGGSPAVIVNLLVSVFVSLTNGSSVIVAQLFGAGKEKDLKRATGTTMVFFFLLGAVLTLLCEPLTYWFLDILSTPADTREAAALYLRIVFGAAPLLMLVNAQSGLLRAVGDSRSPFIFMLIGCVTNIILDLVFVIVFKMGVAGVAWATAISIAVNTVLTTVRLVRTQEAYRIDVHELKMDKHLLGEMMGIGVPAALQGGMYGVSNAILQASVNALGTTVVACWALTGKVDGVYWAFASAAGAAITTFAGQNYGAGKMDRVFQCMKTSYKLFIPATIIICTAIMLVSPLLLPLFTNDPEVIALTYKILWYFVPFYFTWTLIEVVSGILRGCSNVRIPVLITGLGICLFRVIWVSTVCRVNLTVGTVSICYPVSWGITGICMLIYFFLWKKKHFSANRDVPC